MGNSNSQLKQENAKLKVKVGKLEDRIKTLEENLEDHGTPIASNYTGRSAVGAVIDSVSTGLKAGAIVATSIAATAKNLEDLQQNATSHLGEIGRAVGSTTVVQGADHLFQSTSLGRNFDKSTRRATARMLGVESSTSSDSNPQVGSSSSNKEDESILGFLSPISFNSDNCDNNGENNSDSHQDKVDIEFETHPVISVPGMEDSVDWELVGFIFVLTLSNWETIEIAVRYDIVPAFKYFHCHYLIPMFNSIFSSDFEPDISGVRCFAVAKT